MNPTNFPYLPHTDSDRKEMLKSIGVNDFEELIRLIPSEIRSKELDLAEGLSEQELAQKVKTLANKNKPAGSQLSFLGGGSYRRYVPAIVPAVLARSEFSTAYTPYQGEASQGTLQVIYEFQTAISLITSMDVTNASMYDGPTACAEAAMMAIRLTGRNKIAISSAINPEYLAVTRTYVESAGFRLTILPTVNGATQIDSSLLDDQIAAVIVQYPNYFGIIEQLDEFIPVVHSNKSLLIVASEPISLGLLTPPGEFGVDIVIGDAQSCGNFLSYGGPSAGYITCRKEYVRQLPGRIVGATVDNRGQRAFVLTLQAREQHIRRTRATSNICTNQSLNALAMLVYLTMLGPKGLRELQLLSMQRARYLVEHLESLNDVKLLFDQPFTNEFVITTPLPANKLLKELKEKGILGGISLEGMGMPSAILVCVTEMNSREELDKYVEAVGEILLKSKEKRKKIELSVSISNQEGLPRA